MKKDDMREQLDKEVEEFLRSGKKITQLPPAPEEATLSDGMEWWTVFEPEEEEVYFIRTEEDEDYHG